MIRSQSQIESLTDKVEANMFQKMMTYADDLSVGLAPEPDLDVQNLLIFALNSDYSTLAQKNVFANMAAARGYDFKSRDTLGVAGLFDSEV